jgi:hypothetical protein
MENLDTNNSGLAGIQTSTIIELEPAPMTYLGGDAHKKEVDVSIELL